MIRVFVGLCVGRPQQLCNREAELCRRVVPECPIRLVGVPTLREAIEQKHRRGYYHLVQILVPDCGSGELAEFASGFRHYTRMPALSLCHALEPLAPIFTRSEYLPGEFPRVRGSMYEMIRKTIRGDHRPTLDDILNGFRTAEPVEYTHH